MIHDTEFYKLRSCVETDKADIDRLYRMFDSQRKTVGVYVGLSISLTCFTSLLCLFTIINSNGIDALKAQVRTLEKTPRTVAITYTPPTGKPSPEFRAAFVRKSGLKPGDFDSLPGFNGLHGPLTVLSGAKREVARR